MKNISFVLMMLPAACCVAAQGAVVRSLAGEWRLEGDDQWARKIECPITVPGDVHSALQRAGRLIDVYQSGWMDCSMNNPYWGRNEVYTQWVGQHDWVISREFDVDSAVLSSSEIVLRLEDVDCFASIFVNDIKVGTCADRFQRYEFDVKRALKIRRNVIRGVFESAERKGLEIARTKPLAHPMSNSFIAKNLAVVRKDACHGGWDWGPAQMVTGFCGPVTLVAADRPRTDYVYTMQKFNDNLTHCTLTVVADKSDGSRTQKVIEIDNPPLWWPNGMGDRRFYEYEFEGVSRRIGLRKLEVLREGGGLQVVVNNHRVFCKGANWIPCDAFENRQTREKYRDLVKSAADANMNMLRVWGGGQFEHDEFYEACDEYGILLWHDMMCSCARYPGDAEFLGDIEKELSHQLRRLRDHASIALWCGDNECLGALRWWGEILDAKDDPAYLSMWKARNELQNKAVAKYDPTRMYWPSSPCAGPGDFANAWKVFDRGDMHNWDVWGGNFPLERFYESKPRFCSEFGYQSFSSMEVAETYALREDILRYGPDFEWHQKNVGGNERIRRSLARVFRPAKDTPSELLLSQIQQAVAIRTAVEYWRTLKPWCMGTLFWQLNDNWPVASWSSVEYGGKWKPLQYAAKRFYAPVAAFVDPERRIKLVNDFAEDLPTKLTLRYVDFTGRVVRSRLIETVAKAAAAVEVAKAEPPPDTFLVVDVETDRGSWRNDHHFASSRNEPYVGAKVDWRVDGFNVVLKADRPAFFVWANAYGLPGEFDDNAFTLLPGETKVIRFTPKTAAVTESKFLEALSVTHLDDLTKPRHEYASRIKYEDEFIDRMWLWGHLSGQVDGTNNLYNLDVAKSDYPMSAALKELGLRNLNIVRWDRPSLDALREFKDVKRLTLPGSAHDAEKVKDYSLLHDHVFAVASKMENVVGIELDDYYRSSLTNEVETMTAIGGIPTCPAAFGPKQLAELRRRADRFRRPLDIRLVVYDGLFTQRKNPLDIIPAIDQATTVTYWTWKAENLKNLEKNFRFYRTLAPTKPTFLGIYLYDFGGEREMTAEEMRFQLDFALRKFREGEIEGVVFLCSSIVNRDFEAIRLVKEWIGAHGKERCAGNR